MTEKTHPDSSASQGEHGEEDIDITPAAVLATRRSLRTGLMWCLVAALIVGVGITIAGGPKMGAYYFALLIAVTGTLRWALPGQPFGIAARERKWMDVVFCYGICFGLIFLASTSYALKCAEGIFC